MKFENHMILKMPSYPANTSLACAAVESFASQMGPSVVDLGDIRTAVSEAVSNSIAHAYKGTPGNINIRCRILKDNVLDIVVKDAGTGITNIEEARKPLYTTGGKEHSGMGFTIMESFMDSCEVSSQPGKGTTVHMRKQLPRESKEG